MGDNAEGIVPQAAIPDHRIAADTELLGQRDGGRVCERQLIASRLSRFGGFHAKYSCKIIEELTRGRLSALTPLVTSWNVLFNQIDGKLVGPVAYK